MSQKEHQIWTKGKGHNKVEVKCSCCKNKYKEPIEKVNKEESLVYNVFLCDNCSKIAESEEGLKEVNCRAYINMLNKNAEVITKVIKLGVLSKEEAAALVSMLEVDIEDTSKKEYNEANKVKSTLFDSYIKAYT